MMGLWIGSVVLWSAVRGYGSMGLGMIIHVGQEECSVWMLSLYVYIYIYIYLISSTYSDGRRRKTSFPVPVPRLPLQNPTLITLCKQNALRITGRCSLGDASVSWWPERAVVELWQVAKLRRSLHLRLVQFVGEVGRM